MPYLSLPQTVNAQMSGNGMEGYIKTLSPIITRLPGCKEVLKGGMQDLFSNIKRVFKKPKTGSSGHDADPNGGGLDGIATDTTKNTDSVPVFDFTVQTNTKNTADSAAETEASTSSLNKNKTCLDAIGRAVAKILLNEMTQSMVKWINGGFDGTPKFVHDPVGFFKDIAKNEILEFGLEIDNPILFPFGKDFMKMQKQNFVKHFADNAKYSLNQAVADGNPGHTADDFKVNFSDGGWGAWAAMTQNTANNPIGFNIAASNEMEIRLDGTIKSPAQNLRDDMATANGFLSQERCATEAVQDSDGRLTGELVTNHDITRGEDARYLRKESGARHCAQWENVTPGKIIAESATKVSGYQGNALLSVQDLNDAEAALLDATLSYLVTKISSSEGFAGLSDDPNSSQNMFGSDNGLNSIGQVEKDFSTSIGGTDWLNSNPDFNIRTDLTQSLIDEQRIYMQKLIDQNTELKSRKKIGNQTWNYGLLPIIYQLDYCIPGPHPNWQEEAQTQLDILKEGIINIDGMNYSQIKHLTGVGNVGSGAETALNIAHTLMDPIGITNGLSGMFGGGGGGGGGNGQDLDALLELTKNYAYQYLSQFMSIYLGFTAFKDPSSETYSNIIQAFDDAFSGYKAMISNVYNELTLPGVADQAKKEFNTASGYQAMYDKNIADIAVKKSDIQRLADLKDKIDALTLARDNQTLPLTLIDPSTNLATTDYNAQFEEDLKPYISAFARLSINMKTGDDIAKADSLLQQIKDKEKYIYTDLIKGPTGCEKELSSVTADNQNSLLKLWSLKRYTYPLPILYDYNSSTYSPAANILPDPFGYSYSFPQGIFHSGTIANKSVYQWGSAGIPHDWQNHEFAPGLWYVDFSGAISGGGDIFFDGRDRDGYSSTYPAINKINSFCQNIALVSNLTTPGVFYEPCSIRGSNFTNLNIGAINFKNNEDMLNHHGITTFEKSLGVY